MSNSLSHKKLSETSPVVLRRDGSRNTSETLFAIDRKGDSQNLRYGSIDKYKVPKYRTTGHGRLIGLDRRFKISVDTGTDRRVEDESLDSSRKSLSFPLLQAGQASNDQSPPLTSESSGQDVFINQQDFVSFGRKRRRLSNREEMSFAGASATVPAALSSSESDKSSDGDGTDNDHATLDPFEQFKNHPDNKRQIQLRSATDRDPQNIEAWLQLIDHQEGYFRLSSGDSRSNLGSSQARAVSDLKVSLYEKAIAAVKDVTAKEKLIRGLMKEGSKIWDTNRQAKEWKSILSRTRSIDLWFEYLNFQQTNAIAFSYDGTLRTYLDIFKLVSDSNDGDRDFARIYLTLRLTTFMYEAGFTERAVATWQALLEFNYMDPPDGRHGINDFKAFWDSECSRVGEKGAQGWLSGLNKEARLQTDEPLASLRGESLFSEWGEAEDTRSTRDILPARTLDDTVEDDPFRVILFSDIEGFLFRARSSDGKLLLKQALLKFCGLPANANAAEQSRRWWTDPFLCDFTPDVPIGVLADENVLFASSSSSLQVWNMPVSRSENLRDFALQALTLLTESSSDDDGTAEYVIALQLQYNHTLARKLARTLLKRRSSSLLLYNAFGLTEARSHKVDSADNVWSTALSMSASLGSAEQRHKIVLWHSWIWELVEQKRYENAKRLLIEAVSPESISAEALQELLKRTEDSSTQQLRADAYFRAHISDALANRDESVVELTSLYAVLRYLLKDRDLKETIRVYQSSLSLLSRTRSSRTIERLHQLRTRHAHFHAKSSPHGYRPMQLIALFRESLSAFPDNSMFFRMVETYSRRAGAFDWVHRVDVKNNSKSGMMTDLYAISKAKPDLSSSEPTAHSVRRAFARATESDSPFRHCPSVWLCWIQWELSLIQTQKNRDFRAFRHSYFSAMRCCPWAKDLYLQGFVRVEELMMLLDQDLTQVYRSMSERGLRVRHDITDMLDE